jgi:hypothetical protein
MNAQNQRTSIKLQGICMQKMLFSKSNTVKFDQEVVKVVHLYNQLSATPLKKIHILDAVSKVFGYTNWANLKAVNKSDREHLPLSFTISSHVRAICSHLNEYLRADGQLLLAAVSLVELQVNDIDNALVVNQETKTIKAAFSEDDMSLCSSKNILWFTDDINHPTKHLIYDQKTGLMTRDGIVLRNFKLIFPELGEWLQAYFSLNDDFLLLFKKPIWWIYAANFHLCSQSELLLEIRIEGARQLDERLCYYPIYVDKLDNLTTVIADAFAEKPPYCCDTSHFDVEMSDVLYVDASIQQWKSETNIVSVQLLASSSLVPQLSKNFDNEKWSTLPTELLNLANHVLNTDFTFSIDSWEPRYQYEKSGKKIMIEPWIVKDDIKQFILVNEIIHSELQELANSTNFFIECKVLDDYNKQKYSGLI